MDNQKKLEILEKQEELFTFEKFDAEDAWKLGNAIVEEARKIDVKPAISIRWTSGYTVFQYGFQGTGLDHQNWMARKENTTKVKEMSTARLAQMAENNQIDLKSDWFMDPMEYSLCPGAFPIKVKGVGMVGIIIVSGISVLGDHDLIVSGLCNYTGITEVERITE